MSDQPNAVVIVTFRGEYEVWARLAGVNNDRLYGRQVATFPLGKDAITYCDNLNAEQGES
jgi:hypothetical protein